MNHFIKVAYAKKYGVIGSLLIDFFSGRIHKDKEDFIYIEKKLYKNGSTIYLKTIFPYMTEKKINTFLKKLLHMGVIQKKIINKTNFYAINKKELIS